jgi:hypothetical protein
VNGERVPSECSESKAKSESNRSNSVNGFYVSLFIIYTTLPYTSTNYSRNHLTITYLLLH